MSTALVKRTTTENREAWLITAAEALVKILEEAGEQVPAFRVSVGWPGGRGPKKTVRGQCWPTSLAEDGVAQVFISPVQRETVTTLGVLLHEMIHVVDDCKSGHRGDFVRIAKAVGFTPKWTSSANKTEGLQARLEQLAETLGEFPTAAINSEGRAADAPAKQGTRMIKIICPEDGYNARTTRKWLEVGLPICPCGEQMEEA